MPHLNWCNGEPRPSAKTVIVPDGYFPDTGHRLPDGTFSRTPKWKEIPNAFDASVCRVGQDGPTPGCTGCPHRRKEP